MAEDKSKDVEDSKVKDSGVGEWESVEEVIKPTDEEMSGIDDIK